MRRYFSRSLKRMMKQFMLESGRNIFPHDLLIVKKEEFAASIPDKFMKIGKFGKHSYYSLMCGVRKLLREEDQKVLINQRGFGYKLADDYEKEIESYVKLERGFHNISTGREIIDTVRIDNLDESQKILFDVLKGCIRLIGGVQVQLINDLREKKQLPEKVDKRLGALTKKRKGLITQGLILNGVIKAKNTSPKTLEEVRTGESRQA